MLRLDGRALFRVPRDTARRVTLIGIALYVIVSLVYLAFGQVNADEGWYIYASKLVLQGQRPYLDFAYTQMPLLPFVYAPPQILNPGLLTGRLTSIFLSLGMLIMSVVIARRYGGTRASAIAAMFLSAFTFGIYFNSIVKTYALVSFFFTATLFVLSSRLRAKYPLALLLAYAAAFVRITALFFAAPIFLYTLLAARTLKDRAIIVAETILFVLGTAYFLLPDWPAARWDLLDSHLTHWGTSPIFERVRLIITGRLPDIVQGFGPALVLCAAALVFVLYSRKTRMWWGGRPELLVAAAGLVLFAASHLVNGIWDVEYLVPSLIAVFLFLAIALSHFYAETEQASHAFLQGGLIAILLLLPLGESTQHTNFKGGRLPLDEVNQVAAVVAQHSQPGDRVLALEALVVAMDADRPVLPGMTLAEFSLQQMDTATAQALNVVNADMVTQAISLKSAPVLILTDADLNELDGDDSTAPGNVQQVIAENYRQIFLMTQFGQNAENLYVYQRR